MRSNAICLLIRSYQGGTVVIYPVFKRYNEIVYYLISGLIKQTKQQRRQIVHRRCRSAKILRSPPSLVWSFK
jgi:hypothetical protein